MMLCENCQKKKATVHYTEIVKNQMVKLNLCEACAKEKGIDIASKFSVSDLLAGLADFEEMSPLSQNKECSECAMTSREFREIGRFGCASCYAAFEEMLNPLFETIHKATRHVGKVPKRWLRGGAVDVEIKGLEDALQKAVQTEAFEEAVRIRDRIKELKESKKHK